MWIDPTYFDYSNSSEMILSYIIFMIPYRNEPSVTLEGPQFPYPEPVVFQWQSSVPGTKTPVYTGMPLEKCQCASSGLPVAFQWSSSVFQLCKLKLEHHWVLASASVVPVASQCTCGSSGLPVRSVQWYPNVLAESGLEVIGSGHFPACDP